MNFRKVTRPVFLLFVLWNCCPLLQVAQPAIPYKYVRTEFNHLYFGSDSSSFIALFRKMDRIKEEKSMHIRVVHIGGSHVQGGVWSNTFISDLQASGPHAGGGYFAFPYKMAKTNGQPYFNSYTNGRWKKCRAVTIDFCLPLGMSGMSVGSNDSANTFGVVLTRKAASKFVNVIKVYHNFNKSFQFNLNPADSFKVERKEFEDQGFTEFRFSMPVDSVSFAMQRIDTLQKDFVLFGFSLENDLTSGYYLAGLGVNGASSGSFRQCSHFEPQLATIKADLFILSLGVNDSQSKGFDKDIFIANYDTLINTIRKIHPDAAILLTTTTDNYVRRKTPNKRTAKAREAMFELMNKHNVAVWDIFSIMGGYKSMPKWLASGLASRDKVHFTNKGYILLGDLMYGALIRSYNNNKEKK